MNPTDSEYRFRINKAQDYIERNLEKQISLEELAEVANFSKFHFNRIFKSLVGETPFQFITRLRMQRGVNLLSANQYKPIHQIASECAYTDHTIFTRTFRQFYGCSPTSWRNRKINLDKCKIDQDESNNRLVFSNTGKTEKVVEPYLCTETKSFKWQSNMEICKGVEVMNLPKMNVVYVRHTGPYKGNSKLFESLWNKICTWAGPRGLFAQPDLKSLVVYHDDPKIASEDKLRMSICLTAPEDIKTDGEIGKMEIAGGTYAVAHFEIDATQFEQAWDWVYSKWLPSSGYQPDENQCFELYPKAPENGRFTVDICIPVRPL